MGTTMSFYHIMNRGLDQAQLRDGLNRFYGERGASSETEADAVMKVIMGEEGFQEYKRENAAARMVAYRRDAAWLPFFDPELCEGYNASSQSIQRLSQAFQAPILAFSIFDSDILMLSYCDAAKNIAYDYAKPNFDDMDEDEYDAETFECAFPQFLTGLCPGISEEKLQEIWDAEEVFADDRMAKLSEAIQAVPVYREVPEGFEAVRPSED